MSSCGISSGTKTSATESSAIEILNYENLKEALAENKSYMIDVRETKETIETGMIPGFINIPLGEIESALQLSPQEFQKKYNALKPEHETPIIFSCKGGNRGYAACNKAMNLGFQKVANYGGAWREWESKTKGEQNK